MSSQYIKMHLQIGETKVVKNIGNKKKMSATTTTSHMGVYVYRITDKVKY